MTSQANKLEIPDTEKVTLSWALKHLPLSWYMLIISSVIASFSLGMAVKSSLTSSAVNSNAVLITKLTEENYTMKQDLREANELLEQLKPYEAQSLQLQTELTRVQKENKKLETQYYREYQRNVLLQAEKSIRERAQENKKS